MNIIIILKGRLKFLKIIIYKVVISVFFFIGMLLAWFKSFKMIQPNFQTKLGSQASARHCASCWFVF